LPPVLARIYAARGIHSTNQLGYELAGLLPFTELKNAQGMARRLADAIAAGKRLLIVADYDSDGATACAVAVRALREFGADVDYIVPNRFEYGYGLTPEIVQLAAQRRPDILITVDNGIASVDGVAAAGELGIETLVTDHHLPGDDLPQAACIVNPNQAGCAFPSKHLAGVGVIFYVMLALRAELRNRGAFAGKTEPNLAKLLDLVALGTVADVVKLDDNNRILVRQGLKRIRAGHACAGIRALLRIARREPDKATAYDLGFIVGPRLNAAGRLDDMALGIECLLCDDETQALAIAEQLDALNRERREIETGMQSSALSALENVEFHDSYTLSLYDESWHPGIIGILASRLKDKFHRPVIAFAPGFDGELKGSGRSIRGLHLRDALDLVTKRHPHLVQRFGGHAAACGLTIAAAHFDEFARAFESVAQSLLSPADLEQIAETDGALAPHENTLELAQLLREQIWGQGFPQPSFSSEFQVENQRVVGEKHLKLKLGQQGQNFDAILFSHNAPLPAAIHAVYRLDVNEYKGAQSLQLIIEHWESV
jgi:single-stranded-DNA-specific exonuclease